MGIWDSYIDRVSVHGRTKRDAVINREKEFLERKMIDSASYFIVDVDGVQQEMSIANSDNLSMKTVFAKPGEKIKHGGLVLFKNTHWLITDVDPNDDIYSHGTMTRCNHLLKWIDPDDHRVHEQWSIVEDGTKYLTGEYEDRDFIVTRGDMRVSLTIAKNNFTEKFTRENRFFLDDIDAKSKIVYRVSKPLRLGLSFDGVGCYRFVLVECNREDNDNEELGITDYYKYFDRNTPIEDVSNPDTERMVWL